MIGRRYLAAGLMPSRREWEHVIERRDEESHKREAQTTRVCELDRVWVNSSFS